jgi:hypothetical protein
MAFWLALVVLLVGIVVGIAFAVIRGIALWRDIKRSSAALGAEMALIGDATLQIDHHLAAAEAASGRLHASMERLAVSRARLEIQLAAVQEARAQVRRVFWFVPGI